VPLNAPNVLLTKITVQFVEMIESYSLNANAQMVNLITSLIDCAYHVGLNAILVTPIKTIANYVKEIESTLLFVIVQIINMMILRMNNAKSVIMFAINAFKKAV